MNVALNARQYEVIKTNNEEMIEIAKKVKAGEASRGEIDSLVRFTIDNQDIEYAYEMMENMLLRRKRFLTNILIQTSKRLCQIIYALLSSAISSRDAPRGVL